MGLWWFRRPLRVDSAKDPAIERGLSIRAYVDLSGRQRRDATNARCRYPWIDEAADEDFRPLLPIRAFNRFRINEPCLSFKHAIIADGHARRFGVHRRGAGNIVHEEPCRNACAREWRYRCRGRQAGGIPYQIPDGLFLKAVPGITDQT